MSTTIKRIALVAVAALGLGVLSVAPSQAANVVLAFDSGDSAGTDNTTGYGVAGAYNYVTVKVIGSPSSDYVLTTTTTFVNKGTLGSDATIASDGKSISTVGALTGDAIRVATPAVGTVTVSYFKRTNGALATTATESVNITVNASAQSGTFSAANSTAVLASGETTTIPATDATVTKLATINLDTAAATVKVVLKDNLKAAYNDTVTATVISGSANVLVLLDSDSTTVGLDTTTSKATAGTASSAKKTTNGIAYVLIYSSGIAGPASVKISLADGTVVATKSVTFSSTTVASITPSVDYALVSADSAGQPTDGTVDENAADNAISLTLKDAAGYVVASAAAPTVTTDVSTYISGVTCSAASALGVSTCAVTPVAGKYGKTVLTFKTGTVTATASITTAAPKASAIAITAPASVEAGSLVEFTFAAKDASGNPIADGDYLPAAFIKSVASSASSYAFAATDTISVTNGVATAKVYAPYVTGTWKTTWTLQGTAATASAVAVGTNNVAAAIAGTKVVVDVAITNAGVDAATDAANEAAQAASDATDAALAAADAADAATTKAQEAVDAVATLSAEVSKLITALKAQITTLTNLVIKIQKKVKA